MIREIKARFSRGRFEPLEKVEMEEGTEVTIAIKEAPSVEDTLSALEATDGAWRGTHDPEELKRNIYTDRLLHSRPEPRL